jgi:hypothetical protein
MRASAPGWQYLDLAVRFDLCRAHGQAGGEEASNGPPNISLGEASGLTHAALTSSPTHSSRRIRRTSATWAWLMTRRIFLALGMPLCEDGAAG